MNNHLTTTNNIYRINSKGNIQYADIRKEKYFMLYITDMQLVHEVNSHAYYHHTNSNNLK